MSVRYRYSPQVLKQTDYWVKNCRDIGKVCGRTGRGNCKRRCSAVGTPGPFLEMARAELMDQPDGVKPIMPLPTPYIDLRNFRYFHAASPRQGVPSAGWFRKWNGRWVRSRWNEVDPEDWIASIDLLIENEYRLCKYDPDVTSNSTTTEDRGPGEYITTEHDGGLSRNVTDSPDIMAEIDGAALEPLSKPPEGDDLTKNRIKCNECGHSGQMRRVRGKGDKVVNRCVECGKARTRKKG